MNVLRAPLYFMLKYLFMLFMFKYILSISYNNKEKNIILESFSEILPALDIYCLKKKNNQAEVTLKYHLWSCGSFLHETSSQALGRRGISWSIEPTQVGGRERAEHEEQHKENAKRRGLGGKRRRGCDPHRPHNLPIPPRVRPCPGEQIPS